MPDEHGHLATFPPIASSPRADASNSIYPNQSWPPPLRLVTREGAVALTVPEIVSLVQQGIIKAEVAAELLGFKP